MSIARVGVIGLGNMGEPMARNLLAAGFQLTVCNRSRSAIDELVAAGASAADSPRAVARSVDAVLTMLPDSPDVAAVVRGESGVLADARAGLLLIDTSTIAPGVARELASEARAHGVAFVDAPVSGGPEGAAAAKLSIMAGGEAADVERAEPVLRALGTTIVHCGPSGAGQTVKACNQLVVGLHIGAGSEALLLAEKAGVSSEAMLRVLGGGLAACRVMDLRGASMAAHDFAPRAKAVFQRKDLRSALDLARSLDATLPLTALIEQLYTALVATGRGGWDHTALLSVLEDLAGC
ncbi:MAG: NAD(P)-dependent oxidoreductase [Vulcanimicrobiaceae bacterium]